MLSALDEVQLRASLERILSSPEFLYAERLRRFLIYSFEHTLKGDSERALTESCIGVEVFACEDGYDPLVDPIVRIEAQRLRAKLDAHYAAAELAPGVVRLQMPPGAFLLEVRPLDAVHEEPHAAPWRRKLRHHRLWIFAVALVTLLAVAGLLVFLFRPRKPKPVSQQGQALNAVTSDSGFTTDPDVAPDGRLLVYASDRGTSAGQLALYLEQQATGGADAQRAGPGKAAPMRLTHDEFDAVEPAIAPSGLWVVYRSIRPEGGLFVVSTKGGEPRQITPFGQRPRVSPDGRNIVFELPAADGESGTLWVTPDTGGEPRQLAASMERARSPLWSEDGEWILFEGSMAGKQRDLWAVPFPTGEPRKLGLRPPLDFRAGSLHALRGGALYLNTRAEGQDTIVRQMLSNMRPNLAPAPLTTGSFAAQAAPALGMLFFASGERHSDVVRLPLDADGYVTQAAEPMTEAPVDEYGISVDQDEKRMAWVADRGDRRVLYWRDLPNGRHNQLTLPARLIDDPLLTANGKRFAVRALEPTRQSIWIGDLPRGKAERVLADGGPPLDWSRDGRYLLFEPAGRVRAVVSRLDLYTRRAQVVLEHPEYGIRGARISPDGMWIAFHTEIAPGRRQIYVAANQGNLVPPEEWRPITTGLDLDFNPAWSADGRRILFLSSRDGFVCLWAQPVDPKKGDVVEDAFPVQHFHAARESLRFRAGLPYRVRGPVARRRNVYLSVDQAASNVWSLQMKK